MENAEKKEVIKFDINPKEFGLDENKGLEVQKSFVETLGRGDLLIKEYDEIMVEETRDKKVCKKAGDLRKKLKKIRGEIESIRKSEKSFYLAGGKFVDAIANKSKTKIEIMENNLDDIEKHFEKIEAEKIENLRILREEELSNLDVEYIPPNLGAMEENTYSALVMGFKASQEAKIKAERVEQERIEKERLEAEELEKERLRVEELEKERRFKTSRLVEYIENYDNIIFADLSDEEFEKICKSAIGARAKFEAEQEAIRAENERLKQEAIKREEEAKKERLRLKEIADKEEAERVVKAEEERKERERLQKIEDDKKAELEKQAREAKEKAERLEAEAERKRLADIEAENNRIAQIEADKQAELNKGDAEKVKDLINDLEALKTKYSFKSAINKKMFVGVVELLTKVIVFINK